MSVICDSHKQEAEQAYSNWIMDKHVDPLDFEQIVQLMQEFKTKLSRFAPASFVLLPASAMAADYRSILWRYISSLRQYGNVKKQY